MKQSLSKLAPLAAIFLLGILVYADSFHNSFHYDDKLYITNNAAIRELGNIRAMWDFFPSHSRFIALISFALNFHFHRLDVFGYHLVNVLIHIANGMLVWWMVRFLLMASKGGSGEPPVRGPVPRPPSKDINSIALAAALIFIAHPIQTQAVTYIAQRMASLATLFYLLSVCLYIAGRLKQSQRPAVVFFAGSFLSAVAGMLTKEIVMTVPLIIAAVELMFLKPEGGYKKIPREKLMLAGALLLLPLLIVPAMFSFKIIAALSASPQSMSHAHDYFTPATYILTQWRVQAKYLSLLFWPMGLNLDHDFPMSRHLTDPAVLASLAFLLVPALLALKLYKNHRIISFGILWFFLTLLPEFVPRSYVIFEHKIYLPSVGFCIAVAAGLTLLIKNFKAYATTLGIMIMVLSLLTFQRNKVWKDDITLWKDVVAKSPNKASSRHNLGVAYEKSKYYDLALAQFNEVLRLEPDMIEAINYRGTLYVNLKRDDLALLDYDAALAIDPDYAESLYNKGLWLQRKGRLDEALEHYTHALKSKPDYAAALNNRSGIYIDRGQDDLAIKDMTQALSIDPYALTIYINRARLYRKTKQLEAALADYNRVLKIDPRHINALSLRAQTLFDLNRLEEAKRDIFKIKELKQARP